MKAIVVAYHNMGCMGIEALMRNGSSRLPSWQRDIIFRSIRPMILTIPCGWKKYRI